jgi:hypothetical protein
MKPDWKKYLLYGSLIIVGGGLIFIFVETVKAKNTGFETKTLRGRMELLVIPLVLAGSGFLLNCSEKEVERNGTYERDLGTSMGVIEDLSVPRTRNGFRTELFARHHRRQAELDQAICETLAPARSAGVFVGGVSTTRMGEVEWHPA